MHIHEPSMAQDPLPLQVIEDLQNAKGYLNRHDSPGPLNVADLAELRSQYSTESKLNNYLTDTTRTQKT